MLDIHKYHKTTQIIDILFLVFLLWWLSLHFLPQPENSAKIFGGLYGLIALLGGLNGMRVAIKWGGLKSVMGRAIFMLSLGMFSQEIGQLISSYYNYFLKMDPIPYPSWGDVGFFATIPIYIYGIYELAKASGSTIALNSYKNKLQAIAIPLIMLLVGYFLFLQHYQFDFTNPLKIFLDFGYPLGDAIYISLTILAYLLSRKMLGGVMRTKILFILGALCLQFLADYSFLYQSAQSTWHVGGINDLIYMVAYYTMTIGIIQFDRILVNLKNN